MATVNFSVLDSIKKRFNQVFAHENKSHLIAELMKLRNMKKQQRAQAIEALLKLRAEQKPVTSKVIRRARKKVRKCYIK